MRNIINYVIFGILAVLSSLYIFCTVSYASALPSDPLTIDPSEFTVLEGGNGAFNAFIPYGYNPDVLGFGLDQILTQINNDMYNKFGYDLQDASWYVEDIATENAHNYDVLTAQITGGLYQTYQEALAAGYMFFTHNVPQAWNSAANGAKQYILGKISESTGNIISVFNNQLVPITDDYFNNYTDLFNDYVDDDIINDFTQENGMIYADSINCVNDNATSSYNRYYIKFDKPCYFIYTSTHTESQLIYRVGCVWKVGDQPSFVEGYRLNTKTGELQQFGSRSRIYIGNVNQGFTVDGVSYQYGEIEPWYSNGYGHLFTTDLLPTYSKVESFLSSDKANKPYLYQWGAESRIRQILGRLKGKYVPSNNLNQIKQILEETPVKPVFYPSPTPNGNPAVGAEPAPTDDFWDVLDGKIDEIIDSIAPYQPYLPTLPETSTDPSPIPDPDPDPEPSPSDYPTGIGVPSDFPTDIFDPFTDVLKMPFSLLSVFEPIFYMFNHTLLFPLWLLVPCFIVICFIIWALK